MHIRQNEHGATLVEATLVLPLFLLMLFISFVLMRLSYTAITLQYLASSEMRNTLTWQKTPSEVRNDIISKAKDFGITVEPSQICIRNIAELTPGCTGTATLTAQHLAGLRISIPFLAWQFDKRNSLQESPYILTALAIGRLEPE